MIWLCIAHRNDEQGRKEFRERDVEHDREQERDRRQREKERLRRQDEDRRKRKERQDGENMFKKQVAETTEDKERSSSEKKKSESAGDSSQSERPVKPARENKRDDAGKRERLRNKVMVFWHADTENEIVFCSINHCSAVVSH